MADPFHAAVKSLDGRVHQGDIFKMVPFLERLEAEEDGKFDLSCYDFPYVVVLTQECDLEQNKKKRIESAHVDSKLVNDRHLISILVAPLYNAQHLRSGDHLGELKIKCQSLNSKKWTSVQQNDDGRYHYLILPKEFLIPESVIDFSHYFSVSLAYFEDNLENRVCTIEPLYKANLLQRFASFLSRVGLPDRIQ